MKKYLTRLSILVVLLILVSATFVAAAVPPIPTYAIAVPDCDSSEWNLAEDGTGDFFSNMYRAGAMEGNPNKVLEAKLYLRFQCMYPMPEPPEVPQVIVYALVLPAEGVSVLVDSNMPDQEPSKPGDAYIKVQDLSQSPLVSGDDENGCTPTGVPPELSWIDLRNEDLDGDGIEETIASGWEASFIIPAGYYEELNVHTQVYSGEGGDAEAQTASVPGRKIPLDVDPSYCPPQPSAVTLTGFQAVWAEGGVVVSWETVSEVDNLGFNLYRAESLDGPRTQLNESLIPSMVFGSPVGTSYEFVDETASLSATSYYWLEDVDIYGVAVLHGPAVVKPLTLRLLPGRPRPIPILIPIQPLPGLILEQ